MGVGEEAGGLELVNFYSKNQNLKIEFFYGGGSERARVSDFVTTYPHVKMFFFFFFFFFFFRVGGGLELVISFPKNPNPTTEKKVLLLFFFCFFFWGVYRK